MKRTTTTTTTAGSMDTVRQAHAAGTMDTVRAAHAARKRRETLTAYRNAALLIICIFCGIFCGYVEASAATVKTSRTAAQAGTVKTAGTAAQAGTVKAHHAAHISRRDDDARSTHTSSNDTRNAAHIGKADRRTITKFCKSTYGPGYKIIIAPAETVTDQELQTRAGKRIIYVDQYQTTSHGKYGIVTTPGPFHGDRIRYATPAPRGRKVTVYLIYDPDSNSTDAVTAIISAGKIRQ